MDPFGSTAARSMISWAISLALPSQMPRAPLLPLAGGSRPEQGRTSVKSIMGSQMYLSLRDIVEQEDGRQGLKTRT